MALAFSTFRWRRFSARWRLVLGETPMLSVRPHPQPSVVYLLTRIEPAHPSAVARVFLFSLGHDATRPVSDDIPAQPYQQGQGDNLKRDHAISVSLSPQWYNLGVGQSSNTSGLDVTALFSSLFNTGSNEPQANPTAGPPPPTDAAGIGQGFQGITQGYEGLNTMPRPQPQDDSVWGALSAMFGSAS